MANMNFYSYNFRTHCHWSTLFYELVRIYKVLQGTIQDIPIHRNICFSVYA